MLPKIHVVNVTNAGTCGREAHCLLPGNLPLPLNYSKCCKYVCKRYEVCQVIFLHSAVFSTQLFICHHCYFSTVLALILPCKILYVTGFAKIALNGTTTETKLTLKLHSNNIQTHKHMAIHRQVYFHRWPFAYPIKVYYRACGDREWH